VTGFGKTATALLAAAACALPAADASAHTMPPSTATSVAKQAVAKIGRETHASSGKVLSCRRKTAHRFLCKGQESYKTGASRCTFDIVVRYTSRTKRTTANDILNYRCF
jgi:hypothetical protein